MMSEDLFASACEVDILGTLSMHALTLASETPSALLDWNNNYGADPDKAVCFHCSNLPKHFFNPGVKMDYQLIIAGTVGKENTHGTLDGRVKAGPMTFARFSTDDFAGTDQGLRRPGQHSPTTRSPPSAAPASSTSPTCRNSSATSASTASSTTSPPASPPPPPPSTRPPPATSTGPPTGTSNGGRIASAVIFRHRQCPRTGTIPARPDSRLGQFPATSFLSPASDCRREL